MNAGTRLLRGVRWPCRRRCRIHHCGCHRLRLGAWVVSMSHGKVFSMLPAFVGPTRSPCRYEAGLGRGIPSVWPLTREIAAKGVIIDKVAIGKPLLRRVLASCWTPCSSRLLVPPQPAGSSCLRGLFGFPLLLSLGLALNQLGSPPQRHLQSPRA